MTRPSMLPPMIDRAEISAVRRRPARRNGRFFRTTSGIAHALPQVVPCSGDKLKSVGYGRYQQQIEQGYGDIDLESPERLPLDRARFIRQLGDRDHRSKR